MLYNSDPSIPVPFTCNVCGHESELIPIMAHRETSSCSNCHSIPRFRGLLLALSMELFGRSMYVGDFPINKSLRGIGMSEHPLYANVLEQKFDFSNTFYHMAPFLDITTKGDLPYRDLDFLICSEVFEHILPPVGSAFDNLGKLLRPGGKLIFSTPFHRGENTIEHYPEINDFRVVQFDKEYVIINRTRDREWQIFDKPVFHGGPGSVLEMRLFSLRDVLLYLMAAGFKEIRLWDRPDFDVGYYWRNDTDTAYIISAEKA